MLGGEPRLGGVFPSCSKGFVCDCVCVFWILMLNTSLLSGFFSRVWLTVSGKGMITLTSSLHSCLLAPSGRTCRSNVSIFFVDFWTKKQWVLPDFCPLKPYIPYRSCMVEMLLRFFVTYLTYSEYWDVSRQSKCPLVSDCMDLHIIWLKAEVQLSCLCAERSM